MSALWTRGSRWNCPKFDSGRYALMFFGSRIIGVQHSPGRDEEKTYELAQFVQNIQYQHDGVPIGAEGYIIEIRDPDAVSRRSIGDNDEPNGEYILDVIFEHYGVRRRTIHQVKPCLQWWEKNPIECD